MKRNKFTLSHYRMLTADMGELIPVGLTEVIPGDTMQHHCSALIRMSPLNTPVMHPVNVRLHHFFVPHRLLWDGWEDFITGGPDGKNAASIPTEGNTTDINSVMSYQGVPPMTGVETNSLPLRGYNTIYNEFYRDQDLGTVRSVVDNTIAKVAWEKDYFTSARPWTQKGDEVTLPLGTKAPIEGLGVQSGIFNQPSQSVYETGKPDIQTYPNAMPTNGNAFVKGTASTNGFPEIYADLTRAGSVSINDFRKGFALQRYAEARARYGSRYTEYLRYLGITPSDARLQRPEFLGGGQTRVNFSEVLQTTPSAVTQIGENPFQTQAGVGDMYGHGIAGLQSNKYRKFFSEHGYIHPMMSVRPKATYLNGIDRTYLRKTKEDFYQRELAHIGQQEIHQDEIHYKTGQTGTVFGYQDRYSEYKTQQSRVTNEFRTTLNAWHLGRDIPDTVTLNDKFIECDASKRIFQVPSVHTMWVMLNHHLVARRMISKNASGKIS